MIIGKHIHSHWMGECGNGHTLSSSLHARNIQERLCKSHIVPFPFVINFHRCRECYISEREVEAMKKIVKVSKKRFSPKNTHTRHRGPKHHVLNKNN